MRSEAEIRGQVEARLRRWALLALNGILWVGAVKLVLGYSELHDFPGSTADVIALALVGWIALIGLQALWLIYGEIRERLVRRAIRRERETSLGQNAYEKRKRDESAWLPDEARYSLPADDGELVDFPFSQEPVEKAKHER